MNNDDVRLETADLSTDSQQINLLTPSGFFTYYQVEHSKILHGAGFAFSRLYGYQNRQRLLLYTSLTGWLL